MLGHRDRPVKEWEGFRQFQRGEAHCFSIDDRVVELKKARCGGSNGEEGRK